MEQKFFKIAQQLEQTGYFRLNLTKEEHKFLKENLLSSYEKWQAFLENSLEQRGGKKSKSSFPGDKFKFKLHGMISGFLLSLTPPSIDIKNNTESEYLNELVKDSYNILESNDIETNKNSGDEFPSIKKKKRKVEQDNEKGETSSNSGNQEEGESLNSNAAFSSEQENEMNEQSSSTTNNNNSSNAQEANQSGISSPIIDGSVETSSGGNSNNSSKDKNKKNKNRTSASSRELKNLLSDSAAQSKLKRWGNIQLEGEQELYDQLDPILSKLKDFHEHSEPFLQRVRKADAPDYYDIIKNPMDLGTMTKKLNRHEYLSKSEFQSDLNLIFSNCRTYNTDPSSKIYLIHADALEKKARDLMKSVKNIDLTPQVNALIALNSSSGLNSPVSTITSVTSTSPPTNDPEPPLSAKRKKSHASSSSDKNTSLNISTPPSSTDSLKSDSLIDQYSSSSSSSSSVIPNSNSTTSSNTLNLKEKQSLFMEETPMEEDIPISSLPQFSNRHSNQQTPLKAQISETSAQQEEVKSESLTQPSVAPLPPPSSSPSSSDESEFGQREALLYSFEDMTAYLTLCDHISKAQTSLHQIANPHQNQNIPEFTQEKNQIEWPQIGYIPDSFPNPSFDETDDKSTQQLAKNSTSEFVSASLQKVVATTLKSTGFQAIEATSLDVLGDIMAQFIRSFCMSFRSVMDIHGNQLSLEETVEQALKRGGTSAFPLNSFMRILPVQQQNSNNGPQSSILPQQQSSLIPVQPTTKSLLNELLTPISQESTSNQDAIPLLAD